MNFKTRNQLIIGLTGGILCGKSTALQAFARCGAFTLSCDELVREISVRPTVKRQIAALTGAAEKEKVAQKVFSSGAARKKLEALLHPLVAREIKKRLAKDHTPLRVVEVPLLFEAGWQDAFDLTLCIAAPAAVQTRRLAARHMSKTDFLKRSRAQYDLAQKMTRSDICLLNDATEQALQDKIAQLCRALTIYQSK